MSRAFPENFWSGARPASSNYIKDSVSLGSRFGDFYQRLLMPGPQLRDAGSQMEIKTLENKGIFVLDLSWIRSAPGNFSILRNRNPWGSDLRDFCLGLSIQHPGPAAQNYNTWTMDLGSCIRDFWISGQGNGSSKHATWLMDLKPSVAASWTREPGNIFKALWERLLASI